MAKSADRLGKLKSILNLQMPFGVALLARSGAHYFTTVSESGTAVILVLIWAIAMSLYYFPFVMQTLYEEEKYGWIITLFLAVAPFTVYNLCDHSNETIRMAFNFITLAIIFFFFFLLRIEVEDWVKERIESEVYEIQEKNFKLQNKLPWEE